MALITLEIQQQKKKIKSINPNNPLNVEAFESIANTVEGSIIPEKLSPIFWQSIVRCKDEPRMQNLLNGIEYVHSSGVPLKFEGLYYIIAHWNYIRYTDEFSIVEGQKGLVTFKSNENDAYQQISKEQKNSLLGPIYATINTQFDLLLGYVSYYSNLYPEYQCTKQHFTNYQVSTGFRKVKYLRNK